MARSLLAEANNSSHFDTITLSSGNDMSVSISNSSCSQYFNENHYSLDQVQLLTDHANRESVKKHMSVMLDEKRRFMEGKRVDNSR